MKMMNPEKATAKKIEKIVAQEISKSARMIELFSHGLTVKEIATEMNVRYNFAYNVVSNHVNMNGIELEEVSKDTKKEKIIELYLEGKSNKEISIDLKTNYNYVFNTLKKYKADNPVQEEKAII